MRLIPLHDITCPHCFQRARIDKLIKAYENHRVIGIYEGSLDLETEYHDTYEYELDCYACSECNAVFARSEEDMVNFLMENGDIPNPNGEKENSIINKIEEV